MEISGEIRITAPNRDIEKIPVSLRPFVLSLNLSPMSRVQAWPNLEVEYFGIDLCIRENYRPFDGPLGKGSPGKEVFNNYDLDEGPQIFPEDYENEIQPQPGPQSGGSERPLKPDDRYGQEFHFLSKTKRKKRTTLLP
ncbi:hypothetical protein AVEN_13055-1 [Araneus ventricosus]|uniref:Uncharacterized protein n=1 Tax=Araneus ventricosus TaxID=182803 RepID=A0A4Y2GNF0_ARAVE|nr:hypothetical protein AVEN_13055-1 [Araneus ventricosus]